ATGNAKSHFVAMIAPQERIPLRSRNRAGWDRTRARSDHTPQTTRGLRRNRHSLRLTFRLLAARRDSGQRNLSFRGEIADEVADLLAGEGLELALRHDGER